MINSLKTVKQYYSQPPKEYVRLMLSFGYCNQISLTQSDPIKGRLGHVAHKRNCQCTKFKNGKLNEMLLNTEPYLCYSWQSNECCWHLKIHSKIHLKQIRTWSWKHSNWKRTKLQSTQFFERRKKNKANYSKICYIPTYLFFFWRGFLGLWENLGGPLFSCFIAFFDQFCKSFLGGI